MRREESWWNRRNRTSMAFGLFCDRINGNLGLALKCLSGMHMWINQAESQSPQFLRKIGSKASLVELCVSFGLGTMPLPTRSTLLTDTAGVAMALPPCDFRERTTDPAQFYCRHSSVHASGHIVSMSLCRICTMRTTPCVAPRPMPTEDGKIPTPPPILSQAWSLTKALASFVGDGMKTVDNDEYEARLAICDTCDRRRGNRCLECGCRLSFKARGRAFECPIGKWASESVEIGG